MESEEMRGQDERIDRAIEEADRMVEQIDETLRYNRQRRIKREAELRRLGVLPYPPPSDPSCLAYAPGSELRRTSWLSRVLSWPFRGQIRH